MFYGEFEHSMDDKGRLFLPVRWREEMGENVFIWRGIEGQVMVAPSSVWQRLVDALGQQNQAHEAVRQFSRVLYAANDTQMDRQGRMVVPHSLRSFAELGVDVIFVGAKDHVELWSEKRWQSVNDRLVMNGSYNLEQLASLGVTL